MFRVTFGMSGDAEGLELSDGLTYVHVGGQRIRAPEYQRQRRGTVRSRRSATA